MGNKFVIAIRDAKTGETKKERTVLAKGKHGFAKIRIYFFDACRNCYMSDLLFLEALKNKKSRNAATTNLETILQFSKKLKKQKFIKKAFRKLKKLYKGKIGEIEIENISSFNEYVTIKKIPN